MRRQLATITRSRLNALLPVGFRWSEEEPLLPHPRDFVDESWDEDERRMVIAYLGVGVPDAVRLLRPELVPPGLPGVPDDIRYQASEEKTVNDGRPGAVYPL